PAAAPAEGGAKKEDKSETQALCEGGEIGWLSLYLFRIEVPLGAQLNARFLKWLETPLIFSFDIVAALYLRCWLTRSWFLPNAVKVDEPIREFFACESSDFALATSVNANRNTFKRQVGQSPFAIKRALHVCRH